MLDPTLAANAMFDAMADYVERATAPLRAEIASLRERIAAPVATSELAADPVDLDARISDAVRTQLAAMPVAKDGEPGRDGADGKDGMPGEKGDPGVDGKDGGDGKDGEPGRDGADGKDGMPGEKGDPGVDGKDGGDGKDGEAGCAGADGKDGMPGEKGEPGADGKDGEPGHNGKDADPDTLKAMVTEAVAALPAPKDGTSVTLDDVAPLVAETVERALAALPAPKDGVGVAGAVIDRSGALILTLTDGKTVNLGGVVGRDVDPDEVREFILAEIARIPAPIDGKDGLGFDDMTEDLADDGRTIVRTYRRGEEVREFRHRTNAILYQGVFKDGETYAPGDMVTWGGSLWHCGADTSEKPGEGSVAWKLAVKKGRDGKDGDPGKQGDPGPKGDDGRNLTQLGPDGRPY